MKPWPPLLLVLSLLAACGGSVDREDPTLTLTAPHDLATGLSGPLTLTADAADDSGIERVEFEIDGVVVGRVTRKPYALDIDTGAYAPGQHIVRARARDDNRRQSPWASATVSFAGTRSAPAGFEFDGSWAGGLEAATAFVQTPDGRFFVAQKDGRVRIVDADGDLLNAPLVALANVDTDGERGLIGIALHPAFADNGLVYVHYTTSEGGAHNRIARFRASGDTFVTGSLEVLVELPALSSATRHNGGALHFDADGKLYVGVGDNGDGEQAQDRASVFGKLLRFNDDGTIPEDNPFFARQTGLARAVWAYGLRNPSTFAFEPGTGRLFVNDVGAAAWEETDEGAPGANFGWPDSEGPTGADDEQTPLFAYGHQPANPPGSGTGGFLTGTAITGGAFYPAGSGNFPDAYTNAYYFADFGAKFIARLDLGREDTAYAFAQLADSPVDLLVGRDGALYVLTLGGMTRIRVP